MAKNVEGTAAERTYQVSEAQLRDIERAIADSDRTTDMAFAGILRDRSEGLTNFINFTRQQIAEVGAQPWMVKHLVDMLEQEDSWLRQVALKIDPPQGSS